MNFPSVWGPDIEGQKTGAVENDAEGIGGLLAVIVASNNTSRIYLPLTDGLGNVCGLIDSEDGSLAAEYDYDPYGGVVIERGPAAGACPFRHRTRYYDPETWLYYNGHRYYDPSTTKWISKDPKGEAGGWNLTAFCGNDPINNYDALGLEPQLYGWTDPQTGMMRYRMADTYDVYYLGFEKAVVNGESSLRNFSGAEAADLSLADFGGDSLRMMMGDGTANAINALSDVAPLAAVSGSTMIPGVGEAQDLAVLFGVDSSGLDRILSAGSLTLGMLTAGVAPNFGGAAKTGRRAIVIGEGMEDVRRIGRNLDVRWYQAWKKNFPQGKLMTDDELLEALLRNQRWIKQKVRQGYEIYDIGPRVSGQIKSPFYRLEKEFLDSIDYPVIGVPR